MYRENFRQSWLCRHDKLRFAFTIKGKRLWRIFRAVFTRAHCDLEQPTDCVTTSGDIRRFWLMPWVVFSKFSLARPPVGLMRLTHCQQGIRKTDDHIKANKGAQISPRERMSGKKHQWQNHCLCACVCGFPGFSLFQLPTRFTEIRPIKLANK